MARTRLKAPSVTAEPLLELVKDFPWDEWQKKLAPDLYQSYRDIVVAGGTASAEAAGGTFAQNDPFLNRYMTRYVGERITQLDQTTRDTVAETIRAAFDAHEGASVRDLTVAIRDAVRQQFEGYEEWRALRIARTESAIGWNHGNVLGFAQAGVDSVDVQDGTDDDECADANGETWTLSEALNDPIGHPNCVRSFTPNLDGKSDDADARRARYERFTQTADAESVAVTAAARSERLVEMPDPHEAARPADDDDGEAPSA